MSVGGWTIGQTDAEQYFSATNVSAVNYFGPVYLTGFGGLLAGKSQIDASTESNGTAISSSQSEFGELRLGDEAVYDMDKGFEPQKNSAMQIQFQRGKVAGTTAGPNPYLVGLGVRYYGDNISGSVEYSTLLGTTTSTSIRCRFGSVQTSEYSELACSRKDRPSIAFFRCSREPIGEAAIKLVREP